METELVEKFLGLFVDEFNLTPTFLDSYPDDIHPLEVWKRTSALDLKGEGRECYLGKGRLDFIKFGGADVPKEFQGQVNIFSLDRFQISS